MTSARELLGGPAWLTPDSPHAREMTGTREPHEGAHEPLRSRRTRPLTHSKVAMASRRKAPIAAMGSDFA